MPIHPHSLSPTSRSREQRQRPAQGSGWRDPPEGSDDPGAPFLPVPLCFSLGALEGRRGSIQELLFGVQCSVPQRVQQCWPLSGCVTWASIILGTSACLGDTEPSHARGVSFPRWLLCVSVGRGDKPLPWVAWALRGMSSWAWWRRRWQWRLTRPVDSVLAPLLPAGRCWQRDPPDQVLPQRGEDPPRGPAQGEMRGGPPGSSGLSPRGFLAG